MIKISKKQRVALKQIDVLSGKRNRNIVLGVISIGVMALLIFGYNMLAYNLGILDPTEMLPRGIMYVAAMVIAGFCGIMFMHAGRNKQKMEGLRQSASISREVLEAWKNGEIE